MDSWIQSALICQIQSVRLFCPYLLEDHPPKLTCLNPKKVVVCRGFSFSHRGMFRFHVSFRGCISPWLEEYPESLGICEQKSTVKFVGGWVWLQVFWGSPQKKALTSLDMRWYDHLMVPLAPKFGATRKAVVRCTLRICHVRSAEQCLSLLHLARRRRTSGFLVCKEEKTETWWVDVYISGMKTT